MANDLEAYLLHLLFVDPVGPALACVGVSQDAGCSCNSLHEHPAVVLVHTLICCKCIICTLRGHDMGATMYHREITV